MEAYEFENKVFRCLGVSGAWNTVWRNEVNVTFTFGQIPVLKLFTLRELSNVTDIQMGATLLDGGDVGITLSLTLENPL